MGEPEKSCGTMGVSSGGAVGKSCGGVGASSGGLAVGHSCGVELLGEDVGELWPRKGKPPGPWLRVPPQTEAAAFKSQLALRSGLTQTGSKSS